MMQNTENGLFVRLRLAVLCLLCAVCYVMNIKRDSAGVGLIIIVIVTSHKDDMNRFHT